MEPSPPTLFTAGHSNRSIEQLIELLAAHAIEEVADVRRYPESRRWPHFGRARLAAALAGAGIAYRHWPVLGGYRESAPDSPHLGLEGAFRGYADHMATREFGEALAALVAGAHSRRVVLMCAEADPADCHRRLIADALVTRGLEVRHILDRAAPRPHRRTPGVRVEGDRLFYEGPPRLAGL